MSLQRRILQLLVYFLLAKSCLNILESSDFFYQAPYLNIKFMNMTLGMASAELNDSPESYTGGQIAAICQADKLNRKAYPPINFNGIINLAIQEFIKVDPVGQNAILKLISNSLFNKTTNLPLSSYGIDNLAGFVGTISSGENRINAEASAGLSIPFVSPGTLNQINLADQFAIVSEEEDRIHFSIRDTIQYSNLNVLLNLMQAYNWTIGANIFEDNTFGLAVQQQIQTFELMSPSPIFTCGTIISFGDIARPQFYTEFCKCMTNINKLKLLSIWMSPVLAYEVIKQMKKNCNEADDFIFVVTSESQPLPYNIFYDDTTFKSVFIIRPFGGLNFTSFIDECFETSSPQAVDAMKHILESLLSYSFKCYKRTEETAKLPECVGDIFYRDVPCICTGSEFNSELNPYAAQNFFYADAISSYVQIISILQESCTAIDAELLSRQDKIVSNFNFCNINNLTPGLYTGLLALTNFTGYTGRIDFSPIFGNVRKVKTFYLYNVHTTIRDAQFVGEFSIDGYSIDYSKVLLPSGNNTISALVPSNPDLSDPIIAAFFGAIIFILILTFIAIGILLYYKDHILIRRNTPKISFIVLIGLACMSIGSICLCLGSFDWSCYAYLFLYYICGVVVIAGIIAKNYRIYRIFRNKSASALVIKDSQLFLIIGAIFFYYFLLLILAIITNYGAYEFVSRENRFYLYIQCRVNSKFWRAFIEIVVHVSSILLKLVALCLAWLTRKVITEYSESYEILVIISIYICIDITMVPLFFELNNGSDSAILRTVILLATTLISVTATLLILFYYRFYMVYRYDKKNKNRVQSDFSLFEQE